MVSSYDVMSVVNVMSVMSVILVGSNQLLTYFTPDPRLLCFITWYNAGINLSKRLFTYRRNILKKEGKLPNNGSNS